jgi:hypothetical protein
MRTYLAALPYGSHGDPATIGLGGVANGRLAFHIRSDEPLCKPSQTARRSFSTARSQGMRWFQLDGVIGEIVTSSSATRSTTVPRAEWSAR